MSSPHECPGEGRRFLAVGQKRATLLSSLGNSRGERFRVWQSRGCCLVRERFFRFLNPSLKMTLVLMASNCYAVIPHILTRLHLITTLYGRHCDSCFTEEEIEVQGGEMAC